MEVYMKQRIQIVTKICIYEPALRYLDSTKIWINIKYYPNEFFSQYLKNISQNKLEKQWDPQFAPKLQTFWESYKYQTKIVFQQQQMQYQQLQYQQQLHYQQQQLQYQQQLHYQQQLQYQQQQQEQRFKIQKQQRELQKKYEESKQKYDSKQKNQDNAEKKINDKKLVEQYDRQKINKQVANPEKNIITQAQSSSKLFSSKNKKFSIDEIKNLVNNYVENNIDGVSASLVNKVKEVNEWKKKTEVVEAKADPQKKNKANNNFNTGAKFKANEEANAIRMGINYKKSENLQIQIGKNQTLEARKMKNEIKDQAQTGARTLMEQEQKNLGDAEKVKRQIVFNLNLLAPENLQDIEKDLEQYLYTNQKNCEVMVAEIIGKAWEQPKYASTYAKLCREFAKKPNNLFTFLDKSESNNPFKQFLIEKVQKSFMEGDKKIIGKSEEEQQLQLKQIKKRIFGNLQFIAELIIIKVLNKKITKFCISQLLATFFNNYYHYQKTPLIEYSYYDYYFEAIIRFIECVGEKYETIDDDKKATFQYKDAEEYINQIVQLQIEPNKKVNEELKNLKVDQYFRILVFLDNKIIKQTHPRLSALLKNLEERRDNKWQRHLVESQQPQKLGQSEENQDKISVQQLPSQKSKTQLSILDKRVKDLLQGFTNNYSQEMKDIKMILKKFTEQQFIFSYLKQVADEKKQFVSKRVELFSIIFVNFFNPSAFKRAWKSVIKELAYSSSDFPYCGACLAKIIQMVHEKRSIRLEQFFIQSEDEDQQFFMEEIYQKLYHYTKLVQLEQLIEIKPKLTGLI